MSPVNFKKKLKDVNQTVRENVYVQLCQQILICKIMNMFRSNKINQQIKEIVICTINKVSDSKLMFSSSFLILQEYLKINECSRCFLLLNTHVCIFHHVPAE